MMAAEEPFSLSDQLIFTGAIQCFIFLTFCSVSATDNLYVHKCICTCCKCMFSNLFFILLLYIYIFKMLFFHISVLARISVCFQICLFTGVGRYYFFYIYIFFSFETYPSIISWKNKVCKEIPFKLISCHNAGIYECSASFVC